MNFSRLTKVATLLLSLIAMALLLVACSDSPPVVNYSTTIAEGRAAAKEVMEESGATALTVALTDNNRIIWSETFGVIDKGTGQAAVPSTMFGIASVSKMFATIATMILVDRGTVALDEPLVTYLPGFSMLSPEYGDITVRMLLNHSSGLPGGDTRNAATSEPYTGFAAQMMEALKYQRLKHTPGYMSVYCNDGFSMLENLVSAVSGKSFPDFVHEEILTPLGMTNTRFPTARFSEGSYARGHAGNAPMDYVFYNVYGSGGIFSTAEDMSRLGRMLLNGGAYGSRRILSESAISAMAQDQTLSSFNPLPANDWRFGLGWDSVAQAGLAAVGLRGWQKGGDISGLYGSTFIVAPDEKLAVTVVGASNSFASGKATRIAELILLRALVERGTLAAMPEPLDKTLALPVRTPTAEEKAAAAGYYEADALYQAKFETDNTLTLEKYQEGAWKAWKQGFRLRSDGWFAGDDDAVTAVRFVSRGGRTYLAFRYGTGAGHYRTTLLYGQRLETKAPFSALWQARLNETWMPVNDNQYATEVTPLGQTTQASVPGYAFVGAVALSDMTPPDPNLLNGMNLLIPQIMGRDLADLAMETWEGQQLLRFGSMLYRPLSGVPVLAAGPSSVTTGADGFAEWRGLPTTGSVTISGAAWKVLGPDFTLIAAGSGNGSAQFSGSGANYLMLYTAAGATTSLNISLP